MTGGLNKAMSLILLCFHQVALAVLVVIGIIVYRMSVLGAMYLQEDERFYKSASLVASATAACINLVLIVILNYVRRPG